MPVRHIGPGPIAPSGECAPGVHWLCLLYRYLSFLVSLGREFLVCPGMRRSSKPRR
jgi:hypothetical protein